MRTVEIRIAPDGSISAQTQGYQGTSCMDALPLLGSLCDGVAVESAFLEQIDGSVQNHAHLILEDSTCLT